MPLPEANLLEIACSEKKITCPHTQKTCPNQVLHTRRARTPADTHAATQACRYAGTHHQPAHTTPHPAPHKPHPILHPAPHNPHSTPHPTPHTPHPMHRRAPTHAQAHPYRWGACKGERTTHNQRTWNRHVACATCKFAEPSFPLCQLAFHYANMHDFALPACQRRVRALAL